MRKITIDVYKTYGGRWVAHVSSLGNKRKAYKPVNVTLTRHLLTDEEIVQKYGPKLKRFDPMPNGGGIFVPFRDYTDRFEAKNSAEAWIVENLEQVDEVTNVFWESSKEADEHIRQLTREASWRQYSQSQRKKYGLFWFLRREYSS